MTAAILLSGGMDSIALAYWKRPSVAVTLDYGQRPAPAEVRAAAQVCLELGIEHLVLRCDCSAIGTGDLAGRAPSEVAPVSEWWPFRNQLLVTLAAAALVDRRPCTIMMGTVASDSAHADGTPSFVAALSSLLAAQEGELTLVAPAISLTSVELVQQSAIPMDLLAWAHSCHVDEYACGRCRGCNKHRETMRGLDVTPY